MIKFLKLSMLYSLHLEQCLALRNPLANVSDYQCCGLYVCFLLFLLYVCFTALSCLSSCLFPPLGLPLKFSDPIPKPRKIFCPPERSLWLCPLLSQLSQYKAFPAHTGYLLHPQNDRCKKAVLRIARFLSPKPLSLVSLKSTGIFLHADMW